MQVNDLIGITSWELLGAYYDMLTYDGAMDKLLLRHESTGCVIMVITNNDYNNHIEAFNLCVCAYTYVFNIIDISYHSLSYYERVTFLINHKLITVTILSLLLERVTLE